MTSEAPYIHGYGSPKPLSTIGTCQFVSRFSSTIFALLISHFPEFSQKLAHMLRAFFTSTVTDTITAPWIAAPATAAPLNLRLAMGEARGVPESVQLPPMDQLSPAMAMALHHLSQQILHGMAWPQLMQQVVQVVAAVVAVPSCAIWAVRGNLPIVSQAQTLSCQARVGAEMPQEMPLRLPQLSCNCPPLVNLSVCGTPLSEALASLPQVTPYQPTQAAQNLLLPIFGPIEMLGVLEVNAASEQNFTAEQVAFLEAIGGLVAMAYQRYQTEQISEVRNRVLESIAKNVELSEIFQQLCEIVETMMPDSGCHLMQLDEAGLQVMLQVSPSLSSYRMSEMETFAVSELPMLYHQAAEKQAPFIWHQQMPAEASDQALLDYVQPQGWQSLWVIPWCGQEGASQGYLTIAHRSPTLMQAIHQPLIQTVTQLVLLATENRRNAHNLEKQAMYDGLTGLPNRIFCMEQLSAKLQARDQAFALLFLDVDHFKLVNDSLGHNAGDELLVEITRRLCPCIRRTDIFARLGGDEFAIILNGVQDVTQAQSIADQIKAVLSLPFTIIEREVFASVSIGIAHSDNYYASPAEILRDADIAMYRAKSLGRSRAATFDKTMHANVVDRMQIEMELRRVVDQLFLDGTSQLQLYYQPIVSLITGRVTGFEALIRWIHPERGLISPLDFIPIAEEIGLIIPIGQWVIQEACQQLNRWQTELNVPDLSMSINVSSRQFLQADFLPMVQQILNYTGISPDCLKLEITESVLMETASTVLERLEYLRDLGVRLSLDDFGTGYSSLSYLQQFPINTLKVDRSFVNKLAEDQNQVVQAIVALTDGLSMDAVAEGIETAEQLAHLRSLGCEYGQGYFFSPPMTKENAEQMLIDQPHWPDPNRPDD
jgi:diguanylate cyclase (GGDEF)-like protein